MVFENGIKNIQAAAYNSVCTVSILEIWKTIRTFWKKATFNKPASLSGILLNIKSKLELQFLGGSITITFNAPPPSDLKTYLRLCNNIYLL